MTGVYVAHEVILRKKVNKHIFEDGFIGCEISVNYFIKEEVILVAGNEETGYTYLDGYKKCNVLDMNSLKKSNGSIIVLSCSDCRKTSKENEGDCEFLLDTTEQVVGVVEVERANHFTGIENISLSVELIEEYNEKVRGKYRTIDSILKRDVYSKVKK